MRVAVHLEPLLLGRAANKALNVASQMQPVAAPVSGRKQGRPDLVELRGASLVIIIIEGARPHLATKISPVCNQLLVAERVRPTDELARDTAALPARAISMLHRFDLHLVPVGEERRKDPTVPRTVAIEVAKSFPN